MTPLSFVTTAEVALIAGLTDQQMRRVVDERLIPDALFEKLGCDLTFTRLGAAFAKFYFATEDVLTASARRQIIDELFARIERLETKDEVLALRALNFVNWKVKSKFVEVDLLPFVQQTSYFSREIDQLQALVTSDPEVMAGTADFPEFSAANRHSAWPVISRHVIGP